MKFSLNNTIPRLGTLTALGGVLAAIGVASLNLLINHVLIQLMPIAVALGCIIYLASKRTSYRDHRHIQRPTYEPFRSVPSISWIIPIAVNGGVVLMIVIALRTGGRGAVFYTVAAITATLLLGEIVFMPDRHLWAPFVLFQIVALAVGLRFTALLMTPSWIGIDIWVHIPSYVAGILDHHAVFEAMGKYTAAPLYHLLVAVTALTADSSLRTALYLSVGTAMPLSLLFVYTGAIHLVDVRWALFATAVYSLSDFVILWGLHLIPTSLGLVFYLAVSSLLIREMATPTQTESAFRSTVLVIVFVIAVTFTHHVSAFITLVFLGAACATQFALTSDAVDWVRRWFVIREHPVPVSPVINVYGYAIFAAGLIILNWGLTPWHDRSFTRTAVILLWNSFVDAGISSLGDSTATTAAGGAHPAAGLAVYIPYIDYAGLILLLLATVIAGLYIVDRWNGNQVFMTLLVAATVMLVLTLLPPLFGLRNLLPGRWFAFLYFPLALLTAIGFSTLRTEISPQVFAVLVVVFVLVFPGSMIITSDATPDQPAFDDHTPRYAHTATELSGMTTIEAITADDQSVYTDSSFASNGNHRTDTRQFAIATVTADPDESLVPADGTEWRVYREYQTTGAPVFSTPESSDTHSRQISYEAMCDRPSDHIAYSNGDVELCGSSA